MATGAQLFDRWFERRVTRERAAFCQRVGLRDAGPFLLFTGSSSFISESHAEVAFVRRWIAALRSCGDAALRDMNILVRPHPYNCHAWDPDPLTDLPGTAFFPRRGYNPIDPENRADFFDSIYHSAGVVGINTSGRRIIGVTTGLCDSRIGPTRSAATASTTSHHAPVTTRCR